MLRLVWLMLGGALGTGARYGLNGLISNYQTRLSGVAAIFPLGTMVVNVSGCFLIGFLSALTGPGLGRLWLRPEWRDLLMVGFCGGYTTFSSYGIQSLNLARDGEWFAVLLNVVASNLLGLLAVYAGRVSGLWVQYRGGTL